MIVAKEVNGLIFVATLAPAAQVGVPGGLLHPWTRIGPGLQPVITGDEDHYFITFNYLGHIFTRRIDASVWPPQVVDPVTYTPWISIQESCDSVCLQTRSSSSQAQAFNEQLPGVGKLSRLGNLIYDVANNKLTAQVVRNVSANPTPALRKKWRVYSKPLGSSVWTLAQDWIAEIPTLQFEGIGSLKLDLAASYGYLWTSDSRNTDPDITGNYLESLKGPSLRINSDTESWCLVYQFEEHISSAPQGSPACALLDSRTRQWAYTLEDIIPAPGGCAAFGFLEPTRSSEFSVCSQSDQLILTLRQSSPGSVLLYS